MILSSKLIRILSTYKRPLVWLTFCLLFFQITDYYEGEYESIFESDYFIISILILTYLGLILIKNEKWINGLWIFFLITWVYFLFINK